ncbi:MAG: hypothetical protein A2428_02820 [Bdellovibrionales bacterium RIFOXYC1_FULL_54_43]|nr:MAG: hypothetical protein A2428_02820 [Bdellovibrionales bacterium RIFOXYC1_FULL_54_43]
MFMKVSFVALTIFALSSSAFALTPNSEIAGKQYISSDETCTVAIDRNEYWKVDCDHLKDQYRQPVLTGQGFDVVNCYQEITCEAIVFKTRSGRPLQAFILKDAQFPGGLGLGLVYGSPADGDVEILLQY